MRRLSLTLLLASLGACSDGVSEGKKAVIRAEVDSVLRAAYDLSKPDLEKRMLSLYLASGPIVSASAGRLVTSPDTLAMGIHYFWESVGVNMRGPTWIWDSLHVDVLSPTSAVVTAAYRVPHRTPRNEPHVIAGAMTAVFVKRSGKWIIIQEHLSDVPATPAPDSTPRTPDNDDN